MIVLLALKLGLDPSVNLEAVESCFHDKQDQLQPQERSWVENAIKDAHYLIEMRKMEEEVPQYTPSTLPNSFTASKPIEMTHVVPVSGLVVGRFMIYSTMLHTCLDVSKASAQRASSPTSTSARRARPRVLSREKKTGFGSKTMPTLSTSPVPKVSSSNDDTALAPAALAEDAENACASAAVPKLQTPSKESEDHS